MRIIKDGLLYLGGELLSRSIPFLLLPFLTRRLGVEGYGEMSYYQSLIALFVIILSFSQEGAIARYYYFYGKRSISLIVNTCYFYTLSCAIVFYVFSAILDSLILFIIISVSIFQSLFNTQLVLRQCQKQAKQYMILQFISALTSGVLTLILLNVFNEKLVELRFLASLVSYILCVLLAYIIMCKQNKFKLLYSYGKHTIALRYILAFGVPLIFHQFSGYMKGQFDRVLIYNNFPHHDLGVYSAAFQISSILSVILMACNKACVPYFYEALKKRSVNFYTFKKIFICSLFVFFIPSIISYFLPEEMWLIIIGSEYVGVKNFITLFLMGIGLTLPYFILVNFLFYYGDNKYITYCSVLSSIAYVILVYFLSMFDIKLVPYALIISNALILPLLYIACAKRIKMENV